MIANFDFLVVLVFPDWPTLLHTHISCLFVCLFLFEIF